MRLLAMTTVLCATAVITASADTLAPVSVWNSPSGTPGAFDAPVDLSVARNGDVFVADVGRHQIVRLTDGGAYVNAIGGHAPEFDDPPGLFTQGPKCVFADRFDHVWGGDSGWRVTGFLHRFKVSGAPSGDWGVYNGWGCNGFWQVGMLAEGAIGWLYMYDEQRSLVYREDVSSGDPRTIEFCVLFNPEASYVRGMAVAGANDEYVFLNDAATQQVKRYDQGVLALTFGGPGTGPGHFGEVDRMASDGRDLLYVLDTGNDRVQAFTRGGEFLFEWGHHGSAPGEFDFSQGGGIDVDEAGYVWVVERANRRIQKFATRYTPTVGTTWGAIKARWK